MPPWVILTGIVAVAGFLAVHYAEQSQSNAVSPPSTTRQLQWEDEPFQQLPLQKPQTFTSQPDEGISNNTNNSSTQTGQISNSQALVAQSQPVAPVAEQSSTIPVVGPTSSPSAGSGTNTGVFTAPSTYSSEGTYTGGFPGLSGASISIGSGVGNTAITAPSSVTGH